MPEIILSMTSITTTPRLKGEKKKNKSGLDKCDGEDQVRKKSWKCSSEREKQ